MGRRWRRLPEDLGASNNFCCASSDPKGRLAAALDAWQWNMHVIAWRRSDCGSREQVARGNENEILVSSEDFSCDSFKPWETVG
jgi:hypothetical protein